MEKTGKDTRERTILDNEAITGEATPELLKELAESPAHEEAT